MPSAKTAESVTGKADKRRGKPGLTPKQLLKVVQKRQKELNGQTKISRKRKHIAPRGDDFDYSCVSSGAPEDLKLIFDMINAT
jgi:hypothetical protein